MVEIAGTWKAYYAVVEDPRSLNPDPDEFALLTLAGGKLTGKDSSGGIYSGTYEVVAGTLCLSIDIDRTSDGNLSVFAGLHYPLHLKIEGNYTSRDGILLTGLANGRHRISALCRKLGC